MDGLKEKLDMFQTLVNGEIKTRQQAICLYSKMSDENPNDEKIIGYLNNATIKYDTLCHVRDLIDVCFKDYV